MTDRCDGPQPGGWEGRGGDIMHDVTAPGTHMPVLMWVSGIYDLWGQTQPFKGENAIKVTVYIVQLEGKMTPCLFVWEELECAFLFSEQQNAV